MLSPYKGTFRVSQAYKDAVHQGLDLVGINDKRLFTPVSGTVIRAGWENPVIRSQGFGKRVVVRIGDSNLFMYFGHLSEVMVSKGQKIRIGQQIGVEGTTGHSTGSHLHWEIRENDVKSGFKNICSYSNIENVQSRKEKVSNWDMELFGLSTLKEGQSAFPYNIYNSNLQSILKIEADGIFGVNTENRVRKFQQDNHLEVDGKVGAMTKSVLVYIAGLR